MKKLIALILCLIMALSLAACGSTGDETSESTTAGLTGDSVEESTEPTSDDTIELPDGTGENTSSDEEIPEANVNLSALNGDEMSLTEILEVIYTGYTEEMPMLANTPVEDAETFEWITFATYADGYEAAFSEPMMSSIAHSVVLVRVPDGTDVEAVRAEIEQNHDPRKWICVEAEKTAVIARNNTILLVMSSEALADVVLTNFDALWAE